MSTIDRRSLALPHEICYRHLHAFRLAQTKLAVPTHHLTDVQWGLQHIEKCHHISTSSAVPSSRQNNLNNQANNQANNQTNQSNSSTTTSNTNTKSGLHMTQTYRVRVCKTCCQESNHIELGTYMDQESAILVNDVFEIMNNRTDRLIVLTKEDRPYLHLIQMSRNSERSKNKDHVSVLELVAARMNALANHHNKLNNSQNNLSNSNNTNHSNHHSSTTSSSTNLASSLELNSNEDNQKKRKQYHPIPLHQEADGSIKNFPGNYIGVLASNNNSLGSGVNNTLSSTSISSNIASSSGLSGSTNVSNLSSNSTSSVKIKHEKKTSNNSSKKNQISLDDFDSLSSAQALVQLASSKPSVTPTSSLLSPSLLSPSAPTTTSNSTGLNFFVNSIFSSPSKIPTSSEPTFPTFPNSYSYVDDTDPRGINSFNTSGPSLKRQRSYTFSTSGDFSLSNYKDSYKHHHHDPIDKVGWLVSLDDDTITVAQTLFELSKKSSSNSSSGSLNNSNSTLDSNECTSTLLSLKNKSSNTFSSPIKNELSNSLVDNKLSLLSSPSNNTESLRALNSNGELFSLNSPPLSETAFSRGMNRRGRSNSMSVIEGSPESSNNMLNYLLAASLYEGENLSSLSSQNSESSFPSSFQFLKDTNSTLRPKDPLCIVLKKYLESGGRPGEGAIGIYPPEERRRRLEKFFEKRKHRIWSKKVKYDVRKNFADSRIRIKGRFVKKDEENTMNSSLTTSTSSASTSTASSSSENSSPSLTLPSTNSSPSQLNSSPYIRRVLSKIEEMESEEDDDEEDDDDEMEVEA